MFEIGIVEAKNIIKTINEKYHFDFSDYALTSFKRRIEVIIEQNNLKYVDILINKLLEDQKFFESILDKLIVPSSEMFRDPSLWRLLRDEIIPALVRDSGSNIKIWLPNSVSGDELFSLTILLDEMGLLDKVSIQVSCLSEKNIDLIKSGYFDVSKLELSLENYTRTNGKFDLSKYYKIDQTKIIRDTNLIRNVTFFRQNEYTEPVPQGIKLVLFRNKMIYFNQVLQTKILKNIYQSTSPGGYLIIGTKESLSQLFSYSDFVRVNNVESIYKRKG